MSAFYLSGAILQAQCIINHGALSCLLNPLTHSHKENIRKEASLCLSALCPSLVKPLEYMSENLTLYFTWGLETESLWEFFGDLEVWCCLLSPAVFYDLEKRQHSPKFSYSIQRGTKSEMLDFCA